MLTFPYIVSTYIVHVLDYTIGHNVGNLLQHSIRSTDQKEKLCRKNKLT